MYDDPKSDNKPKIFGKITITFLILAENSSSPLSSLEEELDDELDEDPPNKDMMLWC